MRNIFFIPLFLFITYSYAFESHPEVETYVHNLVNDSSSLLNNQRLSESEKITKSRELIYKNLDLEWMAKYTLGRNKKNLSKEQIANFVKIYSDYIVKTYSDMIKNYKGQQGIVKNVQQLDDNEFVVKMEIAQTNGQAPIKVDYFIRDLIEGKGSNLKVSDIITEGVSMINSQRDEFGSIIVNKGFEELKSELKKKSGTK